MPVVAAQPDMRMSTGSIIDDGDHAKLLEQATRLRIDNRALQYKLSELQAKSQRDSERSAATITGLLLQLQDKRGSGAGFSTPNRDPRHSSLVDSDDEPTQYEIIDQSAIAAEPATPATRPLVTPSRHVQFADNSPPVRGCMGGHVTKRIKSPRRSVLQRMKERVGKVFKGKSGRSHRQATTPIRPLLVITGPDHLM